MGSPSWETGKMDQVIMGGLGGGENRYHSQSLEGSTSFRSVIIPGTGNREAVQSHRRRESPGFIDEGMERTVDWPRAEMIRAGQSRGGLQF